MRWLRRGIAAAVCLALVVLVALVGSGVVRRWGSAADGGAPGNAAMPPAATPVPTPPPPVLAAVADGPPQTAAGVARALSGPLADPRFGARVTATVLDARTGQVLLDRAGRTPVTPASTAKLTTAAALLAVVPPDRRVSTRLVAGPRPGEVVLVGGGDATLSGAGPGVPPAYAGAARISDLAAAARRAGLRGVTRVVVDGSLFAGPRLAPGWDPSDVTGGYVAPITALMLDGGRVVPGRRARSAEPDLAAGRALAAALGSPAAPIARGSAPAGARPLGEVRSAPVSRLVEQMLLSSDNVLAEALARQVAVAERRPASFAGAAQAVRGVLGRLGVPAAGYGLVDGSGLSALDRATPALLAQVLRAATGPDRPALHALVPGLSVAGYDGTLDDRFRGPATGVAAGQVRAKTGTLVGYGVSSLAGLVRGASGRLLAFAVVADRIPLPGVAGAQAAVDAVAAALARCGC